MFDIARPAAVVAGNRPRILFVGQAGSPTGFARVLHTLLRYLPDSYDLHHLGINLFQEAPATGWTIHPNPPGPGRVSEDGLRAAIAAARPQVVVVVDEPWVCSEHSAQLLQQTDFRTVFYAAIDTERSVTGKIAADLVRLDALVAYNKFGRDIIDRRFQELPAGPRPILATIPHGVDGRVF